MPRDLTELTARAAHDQEHDGEVLKYLITVDSTEQIGDPPSDLFPVPIRYINDNVDLTRDEGAPPVAETYTAFGFSIQLPVQSRDEIGSIRLTIDNVPLEIVDKLRNASIPIQVTIEAVLVSDKDNGIPMGTWDWTETGWGVGTIEAILEKPNTRETAYPPRRFNPKEHPTLF